MIMKNEFKHVHMACGGKSTKLSSNEALNQIVQLLASQKR